MSHSGQSKNKHLKLQVALSFSINKFHEQNSLQNWHTYIKINDSNEGICVEFRRKKQHNIGLPTFKLPASTKNL